MHTYLKKTISLLATSALAFSLSTAAFAREFVDMPDNWTTSALQNAVENGLLSGDGDKIMPDDNITRAQMAAIIVRAFGATEKADISGFTDVYADQWYYDEFSKAVAMGAFWGDGNLLKPNDFITFQECFSVVFNTFFLPKPQNYDESTNTFIMEDLDELLKDIADKDDVAEWAKMYAASLVKNGYWNGIDGKLTPTEYITRSEFAVLMDNLVQTYVNEAGTYTEFPAGNVMVRTPGVVLENVTTDYDIFIGEGAGANGVKINNVTARGLLLRIGGDIDVNGKFGRLLIESPRLTANISQAQFDYIASCQGSKIVFEQTDMEPDAGDSNPDAA